jgi:phosphoglycerate kinase
MLHMLRLQDMPLAGKRVLVRGDLNVPMGQGREQGQVTEPYRLEALLPTLRFLKEQKASTVLLSHLGRPDGVDPAFSLEPIVACLQRLFPEASWAFCPLAPGAEAKAWMAAHPADITVLENLRFWSGEELGEVAFAQQIASLGDIVVQDALSVCHRNHASVTQLSALLPSAAGFFLEQEIRALNHVFESPKRPVMALVGGSKVSTKLQILENLIKKVDVLAVGGAMANTFLKAEGYPIGASSYQPSLLETAKTILETAQKEGCTLLLPVDGVVAERLQPDVPTRVAFLGGATNPASAPPGPQEQLFDIGPQTLTLWAEALASCHTLVWNGPLGAFETPPFDQGTTRMAEVVGSFTQYQGLQSIAGGGDTVAALYKSGAAQQFTHLCSAGGAFLEWLEGKPLPGLQALEQAYFSHQRS